MVHASGGGKSATDNTSSPIDQMVSNGADVYHGHRPSMVMYDRSLQSLFSSSKEKVRVQPAYLSPTSSVQPTINCSHSQQELQVSSPRRQQHHQ